MLIALLVVDTRNEHVRVFIRRVAINDSAARIRRNRKLLCVCNSCFAEQRRIDPVIYKRSTQGHRASAVTCRGSKGRKVTCKHFRRRNDGSQIRRVLSHPRALVAAEEEQLVLHDRAANRSTELVTLDRVAPGGKGVSRIEFSVANEFKQNAVEIIRSRFRDK